MRFDARDIAGATGGRLLVEGPRGPVITDTRALEAGAWFLALRGERFDAHDFLPEARARGCAGAVVSVAPGAGWDRGLVLVPDTLAALQDLAASVRRSFQGPVVGITGSVGKTTTRALATLALGEEGVHATRGNLNNHVGLPLTLLECPEDAAVLVLELGMSAPGEIRRLQEIAAPTVRLVTAVAAAHLEGVGDLDGVARAKAELFETARPGDVLCVNEDDPRVAAMPRPSGTRVVRYGSSPGCDPRLLEVAVLPGNRGIRYRVEAAGRVWEGEIPVPALHVGRNALAAWAVARALDRPLDGVAEGMARFAPVGRRLRLEPGPAGILLLDDAYNANPESTVAALETLEALEGGRRIALLGDMLELGSDEVSFHEEVLRRALAGRLLRVGACGPRMAAAAARIPHREGLLVAPTPEELAEAVAPLLRPGDVVLVKGSRGMHMERAISTLEATLGAAPET